MSYKIMLVEKERIVHNGKEVAEAMNKYLINITKTLRLKVSKTYDTADVDFLTSQFDDHASIKKTKVCYPEIIPDIFKFTLVSMEDAKTEIVNLNVKSSN